MYYLRMVIWNFFFISLGSMRLNKKGRLNKQLNMYMKNYIFI